MSVFLTPDLKPYYGGTYFPPHDGTAASASRACSPPSATPGKTAAPKRFAPRRKS